MATKKKAVPKKFGYATKKDIEDLALMTGRGFSMLQTTLEKMEKKIEKRFDNLQTQVEGIENYIIRDHDRRLEAIETKLGIRR